MTSEGPSIARILGRGILVGGGANAIVILFVFVFVESPSDPSLSMVENLVSNAYFVLIFAIFGMAAAILVWVIFLLTRYMPHPAITTAVLGSVAVTYALSFLVPFDGGGWWLYVHAVTVILVSTPLILRGVDTKKNPHTETGSL